MSQPFEGICDDFHCNMRLGSQLALPQSRETVLHFFEMVQKSYPSLTRFRRNDQGDFSLEEERSAESHRWVSIEGARLSSGCVNPIDVEAAIKLHEYVLELAPYELGVSPIEVDHLDLLYGFDLDYRGNHDELIAETIYQNSPLGAMFETEGVRAIDFQPSITVALNEDLRMQARVDIATRTSTQQIRSGEFAEDAISVYLIVRRYWGDRPKIKLSEMIRELNQKADQLAREIVIPRIVRPVAEAIASRS